MPVGPFQPSYSYATPNGATQLTTIISAVTNYSAPVGAVAFLLQTDSSLNSANGRWRVGLAANATLGNQLEPGRDTGLIPYGSTLSICPEGTTLAFQLTWFMNT